MGRLVEGYSDRPLQEEHHCQLCGIEGHNILTCAYGGPEERKAFYRNVVTKTVREKRSRMYTQLAQRDTCKKKRMRRAAIPRAPVRVAGKSAANPRTSSTSEKDH